MKTYLVRLTSDDIQESINVAYWNGIDNTDNLQEAFLFTEKSDARMLAGQLQNIYFNHNVEVVEAQNTLNI